MSGAYMRVVGTQVGAGKQLLRAPIRGERLDAGGVGLD